MAPPIVIDSDDEVSKHLRQKPVTRARVSSPESSELSDLDDANESSNSALDNFIAEDSEESPRKKRKERVARNSRSSKAKSSSQQVAPRRSTRKTQHQIRQTFVVNIPEEPDELESDTTDTSKVHRTRNQTKHRLSQSTDRTSSRSPALSRPRTRQGIKTREAKTKLRVGERPRDEHSSECAKCSGSYEPDLVRLWKRADKQRGGKITSRSLLHQFPTLDDVYEQGCRVDCLDCTASYHFRCLPNDMRNHIARQNKLERAAILNKIESRRSVRLAANADGEDAEEDGNATSDETEIPPDKREHEPDVILSIKCPRCVKPHSGLCMICGEGPKLVQQPKDSKVPSPATVDEVDLTVVTKPTSSQSPKSPDSEVDQLDDDPSKADDQPLLFRCTSCNRPAHYLCLPPAEKVKKGDIDSIARYWQSDWSCLDCNDLQDLNVEYILAWRKPIPVNSTGEPERSVAERQPVGQLHGSSKSKQTEVNRAQLPNIKDPFAEAEYLCKYENASFTDVSWVPHSYLVAKCAAKLRNFLSKGPQIDLKQLSGEVVDDDDDSDAESEQEESPFDLEPDQDAQAKIPKAWLTPERILSLEFANEVAIEDIKESKIPQTPKAMYDAIESAYIKWQEQSYKSATWSDKTPKDSPHFPAFMTALKRFMKFRKFVVPVVKTEKELAKLDAPRADKAFVALEKQPDYIPHQLMSFQLEGVNFCYYNWHRQHPSILADEMGLGKTVQICSLIAVLTQVEKRMPFLICVPNSTIGNWVRECAKWIPDLKCVPLPGDAESCNIVTEFELFKQSSKSKPHLAAHVVLATYQALEKNANLLRQVQRWEAIIVDEGQRLKAGPKGGLFKALLSLRAGHRILMTGTPLNNNLRELFNLLSFLSPEKYPEAVVDELEERYEQLTPELIEELRTIIRPYMLRRTKEVVLDLPKLTEIIVPISMRPLQKQVYKGLLSKNVAVITAIYTKKKKKSSKASCMNLLMQLRKALAHPYLNDPEIEPSDVAKKQAHDNLVEASGKLVFLQKFIPKLLQRGHRLLVFSQFVVFLDIMERFLDAEGHSYLRLDGNTSQLDRQTRIDAFNRPDPVDNIFLLSTRAGGAGINLATADTVIVLDPDYNPHNDLQAISRAHRFGQKKPVNVFKLMTTASAEERIVQTGKKKLVLDHLVIQKVSEEETEAHDVESILQYGAKELLTASDEALQQDIRYTNEELDDLIQRTSEEAKSNETADPAKKVDKTFAFARVWEGRSRGLANLDTAGAEEETNNLEEQRSFWDSILQANQEEKRTRAVDQETETGRGRRKRRDVAYVIPEDISPKKPRLEDFDDHVDDNDRDGDFQAPDQASDSSASEGAEELMDVDDDLIVLPPGHVPPSGAAKKQVSAERRKRKSAARRNPSTDIPSGCLPDLYPYPPVAQGSGAAVHPLRGSVKQHPNSLQPNARASMSHNTARLSKPVEVARMKIPDLSGLSQIETDRKMDSLLRNLQQKAKLLRDPELDQLLLSVRGRSTSTQKEILMQAAKMVKKLTKQTKLHDQDRQWQAQQQMIQLAQQQAAQLQHAPQAHSSQWPQQPQLEQPTLTSIFSKPYPTQPQLPSCSGHSMTIGALPPPRFLDSNPRSIKPLVFQNSSFLPPGVGGASSVPTKQHRPKNAHCSSMGSPSTAIHSSKSSAQSQTLAGSSSDATHPLAIPPQGQTMMSGTSAVTHVAKGRQSTSSISAATNTQAIPGMNRRKNNLPINTAHPLAIPAQGQASMNGTSAVPHAAQGRHSTSSIPAATNSQTIPEKSRPKKDLPVGATDPLAIPAQASTSTSGKPPVMHAAQVRHSTSSLSAEMNSPIIPGKTRPKKNSLVETDRINDPSLSSRINKGPTGWGDWGK